MEMNHNKSEQLMNDDKRYIWHPFTQMRLYQSEKAPVIASGYGCILKDTEGKEYIDGVSSLWTNVHGHRQEHLDRAVKAQLDMIAHSTLLGLSNVPAIQCAEKLISIAPPGLTRVFYSDSGSTSVEIALKIAFQYHQQAKAGRREKTRFISMVNAYHGDTIGSVSVGGIDLFHEMYRPLLFDSFKAQSPYCYRCPFGKTYPDCDLACFSQLEGLMKEHAHEVCALVIEPLVQGAAGMLLQPPGYLKKVRDLCTANNIFLIADEVAVGFGKTGKMFACEHEGVSPDIMALAKGITGGYLPLAATLATEEIYQGFLGEYDELKTFFHGHTYTGNPLACAAAVANMEIFEQEQVLQRLQGTISHLAERLEAFKVLPHVGDIRQKGIMVGIELVQDRESKEPFPLKANIGHQVTLEARSQGLIIRPLGGVIVLMPPLSVSISEIDRICDITYDAIRKVTARYGRA
jgi:adenosylmethionine-8-amino-7-oxononanoate aminotransferase